MNYQAHLNAIKKDTHAYRIAKQINSIIEAINEAALNGDQEVAEYNLPPDMEAAVTERMKALGFKVVGEDNVGYRSVTFSWSV